MILYLNVFDQQAFLEKHAAKIKPNAIIGPASRSTDV